MEYENVEMGVSLLLGTSIYFSMLFIVRILENIQDATEHNLIMIVYLASFSWATFFYYFNWGL